MVSYVSMILFVLGGVILDINFVVLGNPCSGSEADAYLDEGGIYIIFGYLCPKCPLWATVGEY